MNPTIHDTLLKLKALADQGATTGEREAAFGRLTTLLRKYRIKIDDLLDERPVQTKLKWKRTEEKILGIILAQIVRGERPDFPVRIIPRKKTMILYMTSSMAKEWRALFSHYRSSLRRDMKLFLAAFLHRNDIHPPQRDNTSPRQLSYEETEALLRMMSYMKKDPYQRPQQQLASVCQGWQT